MPSDRPPKKPGSPETNESKSSALERYLAKQKLEKQNLEKKEKLTRPTPKSAPRSSLLGAFLKSPNPVAGEAVAKTSPSRDIVATRNFKAKPSLHGIERPPSNEPPQPASLKRWESVADAQAGAPPIPPGPAVRVTIDRATPSRTVDEISPITDSQLEPDSLRPGEFGPRFIAYMVDICILGALLWPLRSAANLILGTVTGGLVTTKSDGVDTLLYFGLLYAYYGYFYSTKAASPGKLLMGLEVYNPDGQTKMTAWKAFFREAIGKLISTIPFLMGFIIVLIRSDRRALHDLLFDTRVVNRQARL